VVLVSPRTARVLLRQTDETGSSEGFIMSTQAVIVAVIAVLVIAAVLVYALQRRARLKKQFGPEYEHAVRDAGSATRAESLLEARARRVKRYTIRVLTPEERTRYSDSWRQLQNMFVDNPGGAVAEADRLVTVLMTTRGYPMTDFDRQAEDLSVDHPHVISHYRYAHAIATRGSAASTEDLRQAVVHYRALFEELLDAPVLERKHA